MWCICQRMWQLSLRVLEKLTQWQGKEVWCGVFASVSGSSQCVLDKNWHSDRERKFDAACLPVCVAAVTVCAWQKLKPRQEKEVWCGVFASVVALTLCVLDKNWHGERERKFDVVCLPVCVAAVIMHVLDQWSKPKPAGEILQCAVGWLLDLRSGFLITQQHHLSLNLQNVMMYLFE